MVIDSAIDFRPSGPLSVRANSHRGRSPHVPLTDCLARPVPTRSPGRSPPPDVREHGAPSKRTPPGIDAATPGRPVRQRSMRTSIPPKCYAPLAQRTRGLIFLGWERSPGVGSGKRDLDPHSGGVWGRARQRMSSPRCTGPQRESAGTGRTHTQPTYPQYRCNMYTCTVCKMLG